MGKNEQKRATFSKNQEQKKTKTHLNPENIVKIKTNKF